MEKDVSHEEPGESAEPSFTVTKKDEDHIFETSSLYSEPCYDAEHKVSGSIRLAVWYKDEEELLYVKIAKAEGLVSSQGKKANPYVKIYLLPDASKHSKRKTGIVSKTNKPIFNELLKYKLDRDELGVHTLWVSVWDWGSSGRNLFLGEVQIPLSSTDLTKTKAVKYPLKEHEAIIASGDVDQAMPNGRICIALKFDQYLVTDRRPSHDPDDSEEKPAATPKHLGVINPIKSSRSPSIQSTESLDVNKGRLCVQIKSAEGLLSMDSSGDTNPFARCYLLPFITPSSKRKTTVVQRSLNPVWNEEFVYKHQHMEELHTKRALEVTLWDMDRRGAYSFMGCVRLGPDPLAAGHANDEEWMDSSGEEVAHWEEMLANPEEWVERWHVLRPSSKPLPKLSSKEKKKETDVEDEAEEDSDSDDGSSTSGSEGVEEDLVEMEQQFLSRIMEYSVSRRPKPAYYEISGELEFKFQYKDDTLTVHIVKATDLAAANKSSGTSDPYVKLYLLPDTATKRKTKVKRKTLNPIYDQTLTFTVTKEKLKSSYLWVTVWDHEMLLYNEFLGETGICFDVYDLEKPIKEQLYKLKLYDFSTSASPDDPVPKTVEYHVAPKKPIPIIREVPSDGGKDSHQDTIELEQTASTGAAVNTEAAEEIADARTTLSDEVKRDSPSADVSADVPKLETATTDNFTAEVLNGLALAHGTTTSDSKAEEAPEESTEVSNEVTDEEKMSAEAAAPNGEEKTPAANHEEKKSDEEKKTDDGERKLEEAPTSEKEITEIESSLAATSEETAPASAPQDLTVPAIQITPTKSSSPNLPKSETETAGDKSTPAPEVQTPTSPLSPKDHIKVPPKKPPRKKAKKSILKSLQNRPKPAHPPSSSNRIVIISASTRPSRKQMSSPKK